MLREVDERHGELPQAVRVEGAGVIGAVTVSGIPEHLDHMLVVRRICAVLDMAHDDLLLPDAAP